MMRLHWVATGGTIAGLSVQANGDGASGPWAYAAAQVPVEQLLQGMPDVLSAADWSAEQVYSIGSQDLTPSHMIKLRNSVVQALANPEVQGIIVSHGTDTAEDTLWFLHQTLSPAQLRVPVVCVAAMYPMDHPLSDGQTNALAAVNHIQRLGQSKHPASNNDCSRLGLCVHGQFIPAPLVHKRSTLGGEAFLCKGYSADDQQALLKDLLLAHPGGTFAHFNQTRFLRANVAVLYCTPNAGLAAQLSALLSSPVQSLIVAAPGHGNIPEACIELLSSALNKGVRVVRASRAEEGGVGTGGEFDLFESYKAKGLYSEAGDLTLPKLVIQEMLNLSQ